MTRSTSIALAVCLSIAGPTVAGARRKPVPPRPPRERLREIEERDDVAARGAWWWKQRAFPAGTIPDGAYRAAEVAWRALYRPSVGRLPGAPPRQVDLTDGFTALGPTPLYASPDLSHLTTLSGRVRAIAVHPSRPATIYLGAAMGGVWKTVDGGVTWTALTDHQPSLSVGAVAIDPAAPETLYVGTGEPDGYVGRGLLKSTDGGATFTEPAGKMFDGAAISRIVVDQQTRAVYLATVAAYEGAGVGTAPKPRDLGLYRSDDGGVTWSVLDPEPVRGFEVDTSVSPRRIYLATPTGASLLVEGAGITPLGLPPNRFATLAIAPSDPTVLYAGVEGKPPALYRSRDRGATWQALPAAPDYCRDQCYWDNVVAVHPTDPATVYLGGSLCSVWKTSNGLDATPLWSAVSMPQATCAPNAGNWYLGYVHPDVHAVAFDPVNPNLVYIGSDGGIVKTATGGSTWTALNSSLSTIQFYGICVDSQNPEMLYGGAQDNGIMYRSGSVAGNAGWDGISAGDGGPCLANTARPGAPADHALVSIQYATVYSTLGLSQGDNVFNAYPGACQKGVDAGCGDRVSFMAPLAADPSLPSTVYIGTARLWRSTEGGALGSFAPVSAPFDADALTAIAVAPSDGRRIYVATGIGGVFGSSDGAVTWSRLGALPRRFVSGLAVDPADAKVVYAAFSGFDKASSIAGHVFRSDDGGVTWTARDPGIDLPVDAIVAHPVAPGVVYLGNDFGAMVSSDGGVTWSALDGLPGSAVLSLAFHEPTATLLVGTHGRGAWSRRFPATVAVTPAALSFAATVGRPAPAAGAFAVAAADPSGSIVRFSAAASASAPWITIAPASGRVAGKMAQPIAVTVATDGLAVGEYDGTVTVSDAAAVNGKVEVKVHLSVAAAPVLARGCGCRIGAAPQSGGFLVAVVLLIGGIRARARGRRGI